MSRIFRCIFKKNYSKRKLLFIGLFVIHVVFGCFASFGGRSPRKSATILPTINPPTLPAVSVALNMTVKPTIATTLDSKSVASDVINTTNKMMIQDEQFSWSDYNTQVYIFSCFKLFLKVFRALAVLAISLYETFIVTWAQRL